VLIGVADPRAVPLLFPATALFDPAFKAAFDQLAGAPTTIHPTCTPATTALVSLRILPEIQDYLTTGGAAGHPPVIACARDAVPGTLVGDEFVLDAAEQNAVAAAVAAYNAFIQARATAVNFAYVDPNPAFAQLRQPQLRQRRHVLRAQ
jgi:hypothetical protein